MESNNNFSYNGTTLYFDVPDYDNQSFNVELKYTALGNSLQTETVWVGAPLPSNLEITVDRPLPLCNTEPIKLTVNNPTTSIVTWSDDAPNISNPSNKTYQAVIQRRVNGSNVCPSATVKKDISILTSNPTITTPSQTKCQGETIEAVGEANGPGEWNYYWTKDAPNGFRVGEQKTYQVREPGTYYLSVVSKTANCPSKSSNPVQYNFDEPIEDRDIESSNPARIICDASQPISLTAYPGNLSYTWERVGGGVPDFPNSQGIIVTKSGRYKVSITRGSCNRQKFIDIQDNNYDKNIVDAPNAFCADTPLTLTARTNDPSRFDYAWKREGNAVGTNAPTLPLSSDLGSFNYTVEITSKGTGCPAKKSDPVAVRADRPISGQKILLPTGKERAIICGVPEETALDLTATADTPTESILYNWTGSGSGTAAALKASQPGDYKVTLTRGACAKDATVKVESGAFTSSISVASATIVNSPTDVRICIGQAARINASVAGTPFPNTTDNFVYEWFGGADGNALLSGQKENNLAPAATGQYRLRMSLKGSGCKAKDATPQAIKVTADPAIKNPRLTPDPAIICNKAQGLTLTALTDSSAGVNFVWSGGGRVGSDPAQYIVSNAGNYRVDFSRGACKASAMVSPREEELTVSVTPPNASNPILLCSGANGIPMELKASSNLSSATIKWLRDNGADAPGPNTGSSYTPTQSGIYYATANFNGICTAISPQKITTEALANFAVSIAPTAPPPLCDDRPILLTASPSENRFSSQYLYEWKQDGASVKTGSGTAGSSLSTGKTVNYQGNTLVLGDESNFVLSIKKDGCQATSSANKITLKSARPGIIVLDYNTLQATESSDNKYQWYYKAGMPGSATDSSGYQPLASATNQQLLGAEMGSYLLRANRNGCGTKFSLAYYVDRVTALDPAMAAEWRVYPNPAAQTLTVEHNANGSTNATVELWNAAGQRTLHWQQTNFRENHSLEHLPPGVYILKIRQDEAQLSRKILKQ